MKEDITLEEKSPWVKPHNARTLEVHDMFFEEEGMTQVVIRGAKGKVYAAVATTTEDLLAFARNIISTYEQEQEMREESNGTDRS